MEKGKENKGKGKTMMQVLELLQLWQKGKSRDKAM